MPLRQQWEFFKVLARIWRGTRKRTDVADIVLESGTKMGVNTFSLTITSTMPRLDYKGLLERVKKDCEDRGQRWPDWAN